MAEYNVNAIITWTTKDGKTFSTGKTIICKSIEDAKSLYAQAANLDCIKDFFNSHVFGRTQLDSFKEQGIDFTLDVALLDEDLMSALAEVIVSSNLL